MIPSFLSEQLVLGIGDRLKEICTTLFVFGNFEVVGRSEGIKHVPQYLLVQLMFHVYKRKVEEKNGLDTTIAFDKIVKMLDYQ